MHHRCHTFFAGGRFAYYRTKNGREIDSTIQPAQYSRHSEAQKGQDRQQIEVFILLSTIVWHQLQKCSREVVINVIWEAAKESNSQHRKQTGSRKHDCPDCRYHNSPPDALLLRSRSHVQKGRKAIACNGRSARQATALHGRCLQSTIRCKR